MINTNTTEIKSNSIQKESYIYMGVDLSAKYLDVWAEDSYKRYPNDNDGLKQLQRRIAKINGQVLVACEATGSISLYFCEELDRMGIKHKVITPSWVRHYAKSKGQVAKTDRIDSKIIRDYAQNYQVQPDIPLTEAELKMRQLTSARALLIKQQAQIKATLKNYHDATCLGVFASMLETFEKKIQLLGQQLDEIIRADEDKKALYSLLVGIPGIGEKVAKTIICRLPELGHLNRKQVAATIGVCPFNWDSGGHIGKRIPRFGRSDVRCMLFMSILADLASNDSMCRERYDALRTKGKPRKVALIACLRWKLGKLNAIVKAWLAQGRPNTADFLRKALQHP